MNLNSRPVRSFVRTVLTVSLAGLSLDCASRPYEDGTPTAADYQAAARAMTNQMLENKRVQETLARISQRLPAGQRPLIKISYFRNDMGLKVNLITYLVTPVDAVLVNSGKVDSFSEDRIAQGVAAQNDLRWRREPRLPDLVLHGWASKSRGRVVNGDPQMDYSFAMRLADNSGNDFFIGTTMLTKSVQ